MHENSTNDLCVYFYQASRSTYFCTSTHFFLNIKLFVENYQNHLIQKIRRLPRYTLIYVTVKIQKLQRSINFINSGLTPLLKHVGLKILMTFYLQYVRRVIPNSLTRSRDFHNQSIYKAAGEVIFFLNKPRLHIGIYLIY